MKARIKHITAAGFAVLLITLSSQVVLSITHEPGLVAYGSTATRAGDFRIESSDEVYYFQGAEYIVYTVCYDDTSLNVKIAVNEDLECNSYIAYTADYIIFYSCDKKGFGARKVMFSKHNAHLSFNPNVYLEQTVLSRKKRVEGEVALTMIARSLPEMRQSI